ncbi:uncharacterized protein CEXT_178251, partial [Caerostris extrusa]
MFSVKDFVTLLVTWVFIAPCLLGHTQSNDPILKYVCAKDIGSTFWKDLIQCNVVLNQKFLIALTTCIPTSTIEEAENTREYVCSYPEKWTKMMDCLHMHLIEFQDDKDPDSEIGPSSLFR